MAKIHRFSPEKLCLRRAVSLVPGAVGLSALSTAHPCPQRSTSEGGCWPKGAGNGAGSVQPPTDWLTHLLEYPSPKVWALSGNGLISSVGARRVHTANAGSLGSAPSQAPRGCCSACQARGQSEWEGSRVRPSPLAVGEGRSRRPCPQHLEPQRSTQPPSDDEEEMWEGTHSAPRPVLRVASRPAPSPQPTAPHPPAQVSTFGPGDTVPISHRSPARYPGTLQFPTRDLSNLQPWSCPSPLGMLTGSALYEGRPLSGVLETPLKARTPTPTAAHVTGLR